jgi:hypothetical protein
LECENYGGKKPNAVSDVERKKGNKAELAVR